MVLTVYDVETSGFEPDCEVYEFAFIRIDDQFNVLKHGVYYFYKDGWSITATQFHGLHKEDLEPHKADFYKNLAAMYATLKDCVAVGKNNLSFDNNRVSSFIERYKEDMESSGIRDFHIAGNIDIQNQMAPYYRRYMENKGTPVDSRKKGELIDYVDVCGFNLDVIKEFADSMGIDTTKRWKAHGAMFDTVVTLAAMKWLVYSERVPLTPR